MVNERIPSNPYPRILAPRILVSIQNLAEFHQAYAAGIEWIDLKNPQAGSLGAPSSKLAWEVASAAQQRNHNSRRNCFTLSIALGELTEFDEHLASMDLSGYDFAKMALADCESLSDWPTKILEVAEAKGLRGRLIPVYYADRHDAGSPSFEAVLDVANRLGSPWLLIDTFNKSRGGLLSHLGRPQLDQWIALAQANRLRVSLAGSLRIDELPFLAKSGADILAVRSAACTDGVRTASLCEKRLAILASMNLDSQSPELRETNSRHSPPTLQMELA